MSTTLILDTSYKCGLQVKDEIFAHYAFFKIAFTNTDWGVLSVEKP